MYDMRPSTMTHCRACGSERMFLFLPMGDHPPANMFVRPEDADQPQKRGPAEQEPQPHRLLVIRPQRPPGARRRPHLFFFQCP